MEIDIELLELTTLPILKKYAKALRAKIKEKGGAKSTEQEVQDMIKKLEIVTSVISDKEIEEAEKEIIKNKMIEILKNTKA